MHNFRIFIIYPSVSISSMEPFMCVEINGKAYMIADYREDCPYGYGDFGNQGTWKPLASWAGFFFFVYVIGIPVRKFSTQLV